MNKNLRILKFSAFFLGFLFISLIIALIFAVINSSGKAKNSQLSSNQKTTISQININGTVQKITTQNNQTILLTKDKNNNQEIIIINNKLGNVINKIKLANNER